MTNTTWDRITDSRIKTLHPKLRQIATDFINRAEKELGIKLRITQATRTINEQNRLFAQGRTESGKIVTNAQGGLSYHNYGLAFDVVEIAGGKAIWSNPNWDKIGSLGKSMGLQWGGDFKSLVDKPHFQLTLGFTTRELLALYNQGRLDNGFVIV